MFEKPNETINVCPIKILFQGSKLGAFLPDDQVSITKPVIVGQPTITGLVDVNENNIYTDDF